MALAFGPVQAAASPIDPAQTFVLLRDQIKFRPWEGLPPGSGEMAKLYGDFDQSGPYLVLMKWSPGWFSAPHSYATDRIQMVLSGTWWVNSGADFDPKNAVAVPAGGFVKRTARTFHYDGVPGGIKEPVVVAVFGVGPVDIELANPHLPSWRRD
ncbi:MAG TPA: cupin domain-containing protein [Caulobacteraceae bacterium]|nr:cupin domain-containing protein [Caulobacteraceae bacterium]